MHTFRRSLHLPRHGAVRALVAIVAALAGTAVGTIAPTAHAQLRIDLLDPPAPAPGARPGTRWESARNPGRTTAHRATERGRQLMLYAEVARLQQIEPLVRAHAEQAAVLFALAVSADPSSCAAWQGLAESRDEIGAMIEREPGARSHEASRAMFREGAAASERAIALCADDATYPNVLSRAAVAFTRIGRFDDARETYERLLAHPITRKARGVVLCNLAETYVYLRELDRAVDTYEQCIEARPVESDGWWGLASAHDRAGRSADALAAARRALEVDPEMADLTREGVFYVPSYEVHYYLAIGYEARDATTEALAEWQRYASEATQDDPWLSRARAHIEALTTPARTVRSPRTRAPSR